MYSILLKIKEKMFPDTFLVNNRDIIIKTENSFKVYSTIKDFKRNKLILINRTNVFYEQLSLKIKNAIVKKFTINEKDIFEIKTNLDEVDNSGRVKIEKINFDNFLKHFFKQNSNQKVITQLTNIKGIPANITGIVSINHGITMMIFTDISLTTEILKSLIKEINPLNNFYLKNNYPFLNSITFISKKFNNKKLKINNHKASYLKHFKKSLNLVLENLTKIALKDISKNERIIKIEIGLKSKKESLKFLEKIICADYIKNDLVNLDNIDSYYLLQKSLINLFQNQNLSFEINNIPIFDEALNIKDTLKKIRIIIDSDEILTLRIFDDNTKKKKFFSKYTL